MLKVKDFKIAWLNTAPVKTGAVTAFACMTSAALLNSASWLILGAAGAPGKAGFMLAFGVSVIAGVLSGIMTARQQKKREHILRQVSAIADGKLEQTLFGADTQDPLQQELGRIAEAQLKRIEEFHRLLADSRIREERLYDALDQLQDEIAVYDETGMLVASNKAFTRQCNVLGVQVAPGMLRREILKVFASAPATDIPAGERDLWLEHQSDMRQLALSGGKPVDTLHRDGRHLRLTIIETPLKNQIEITTDITQSVAGHLEVERFQRRAEAAEEIKAVTVSRLMDTIRTPMTGVLAAAELLNETELSDDQQRKLDIIRRSSGTLLGVLQDMIDLGSKVPAPEEPPLEDIEASMLPSPRRAVLLVRSPELLERVVGVLRHDSVQAISLETIDLVLELLEEVDGESLKIDFIMTDDASACTQLKALCNNRPGETAPKIIDLNRVMTDGVEEMANPELAAAPAEILAAVIAEEPAAAEAAAKPSAAASMMRALPELQPGSENPTASMPKRRKLPIDVMVVEDNDVAQIIYEQVLSNCGQEYLVVSSGIEGVNTAAREKPRLILMDLSMPGINGIEATHRIRSKTQDAAYRPVIVGMTSHLLSGDREKCLAAGMDDYALKPTSAGPLRAQIASWLGTGQEARAAG